MICCLALFLRAVPLPGISHEFLGLTESANVRISAEPLVEIDGKKPSDMGILPYYLLHPFLYFGRDEWLVRMPSIMCGLFGIIALYHLGALLFTRSVGLLASSFLAVSLWHIHHSTQVRNYAMVVFLGTVLIICFYRAIIHRRFIDYLLFVLAGVLVFHSSYPSIFIIMGLVVWFILTHFRQLRTSKSIFGAFAAILVFICLSGRIFFDIYYRKRNFGAGGAGWSGTEIISELCAHFGGLWGVLPFTVIVFFIAYLYIVFRTKRAKEAHLLMLLILVPILCYSACFVLFKMRVIGRYFIILFPFFLLISAAGIIEIRKTWFRFLVASVFFIPLFLYTLSLYGIRTRLDFPSDYTLNEEDMPCAVRFIQSNRHLIPNIVVIDRTGLFPLQYYLDKQNKSPVQVFYPPVGSKYSFYSYRGLRLYGLDGDFERLKKVATTGNLAVIDWHVRFYDKDNQIRSWLESNNTTVYSCKNFRIYVFIKNPNEQPQNILGCQIALAAEQDMYEKDVVWYPFNRPSIK